MAKRVQLRRGTTAQQGAFTGALAELSVDTTTGQLRVGNGSTPGGSLISPELNVQWFGARGDGSTDNTTALQAAIDEAKARAAAEIVIPDGDFHFSGELDLSDAFNITLRGVSNPADRASRLVYTGDGDRAISLASSQGIKFEHLFLAYNNEAFEGVLVDTGHSAAASDPGYLTFQDCRFAGLDDAVGATAHVRLNKPIFVAFRDCAFWNAERAIIRQGGYANVVTIDNCVFVNHALPPILDPGEAWNIRGCGFQQLSTAKAGAVEMLSTAYAQGFVYSGNWHGDATVAGGCWVSLTALGAVIQGNQFTSPEDDFAVELLDSQGVAVVGNRFTSYHGIMVSALQYGLTVIGNDFAGAGTPIINLAANAPLATILSNNNQANFMAQSAAFTAADGATVDSTYGAEEAGVIANLRTRLAEVEAILEKIGAAAS